MEYGTRSRATVDALIDLEEAEAETIASLEQRQANVANRHWRSVMSKLTATSNDVVKRAPTATARQSMAFRMLGSMNKASTYNSSDNLDALYQDVLESENKESEQEKVTDNDSKTEPNERVPLFQKSDSGVRKSFLSEEIASRKRRLFLQNVDPLQVLRCSFVAIWNSSIVRIGIPLYLAGLVLYFGNIDFNPFILPGSAPCSWWMIFLFHQTILFELSQLTQWIICVALGWAFRVSMEAKGDEVSLIPPVLVIAGFQSKGWPLITTFWSLWNMVFVMVYINCSGNRHVWTGLEIYGSGVNSGDQIITSEKYHQVLLSMLVVGVGKTFERTFLQLSVGKRNIAIFKPRLKKLLKDVALLTDIGILAEEIQAREDNKRASSLPSELAEMTSVFSKQVDGSERNDEDDTETMEPIDVTAPNPVNGPDIMDNLDPWEVPMKRVKMSSTITTHDILLFRRSLTYLNTTDPFGKPFGPAGDRKECVNSAQTVFQRLKKITPEAKSLPFDTIAVVVSQNESEELRKSQRKGLERIFNPNEENQLSLGDFLQGCDTVYKQLLYFRASIDSRLEMEKSIGTLLDWAFCFLMTLIVLSILEIDPMHFVVPATSVLVSISFAIGPSAGKILEGMLFVMLKRPYDLGDRIMIVGAQSYTSAELSQSWLVEDINLYSTTFRHAVTNRVSTVKNWSINGARITNLSRSPQAKVTFDVMLNTSVLSEDKMKAFQTNLENYVSQNSRSWEKIVLFRLTCIDPDRNAATFNIVCRHRSSWQKTSQVQLDQSAFEIYAYNTTKSMGIDFESPPSHQVLYNAGNFPSTVAALNTVNTADAPDGPSSKYE